MRPTAPPPPPPRRSPRRVGRHAAGRELCGCRDGEGRLTWHHCRAGAVGTVGARRGGRGEPRAAVSVEGEYEEDEEDEEGEEAVGAGGDANDDDGGAAGAATASRCTTTRLPSPGTLLSPVVLVSPSQPSVENSGANLARVRSGSGRSVVTHFV